MRFLSRSNIARLQRCSRSLLNAADDDFAWACVEPVNYVQKRRGVAARHVPLRTSTAEHHFDQIMHRIVRLTMRKPKYLSAKNVSRLKHITIWEGARTKDNVLRALAGLPRLSSVDLVECSPYDESLGWLADLPRLASLRATVQVFCMRSELLQRGNFPLLDLPVFYSIAACTHVRRLELTCFESSRVVDFLAAPWVSQFASQLRHLGLRHPSVDVTAARWRAAFTQLTRLETLQLDVRGCYIACLSQVDAALQLQSVDLRVCKGYYTQSRRPVVPSLDMLQQLVARAPRLKLAIVFYEHNASIALDMAQRDLAPHINPANVSFA